MCNDLEAAGSRPQPLSTNVSNVARNHHSAYSVAPFSAMLVYMAVSRLHLTRLALQPVFRAIYD
jgi:hypothetical protein